MPFKLIAKNKEWNKDFWNDLVGPTLKDDMDDETWIRGPIPPIADSDGIHKTFDIKYINLSSLGAHWAWPETHDHAKWGITLHAPWVCVGDILKRIGIQHHEVVTYALHFGELEVHVDSARDSSAFRLWSYIFCHHVVVHIEPPADIECGCLGDDETVFQIRLDSAAIILVDL
jgi:hypothetical protein